jgi:DNA-binding LacI/PurR family transcriptional regulator
VSTATVSRALRDLPGVGDRTRERIREIADELSYVVSPEASRLSGGNTGRVAVVVPKIHLWFYATMLSGIESVLREAELDVLVYQVDGEAQRNRFFHELPARRKVDAVVLTALPVSREEIDRLDLMGVDVVIAGGRIRDYPHVQVDDHGAALQAVEHLLSLGHRRIAMIRTSDTEAADWSSDAERTRGYRDSLAAAGIGRDPALLVTEPFGSHAGADGMAKLLELPDPPTAVFAYSDEIALGALRHLQSRGIDVPGRMSLVGIDGHPTAELFDLTTVDQDVRGQGRLVGQMVLDLLHGREPEEPEELVPTRLVVRGSTGPPPDGVRTRPRRKRVAKPRARARVSGSGA